MTQEALTSESVDKFFESGGQETPDTVEEQPNQEPAENEPQDAREESEGEAPVEEKEPAETEITRNLKAALSEERERRKEAQQKNQRMEEGFQRYIQIQQQQQQPPEPSFDDDPIEAARYKLQQHEAAINQVYQNEHHRQQQADMQNREQEFTNQYRMKAYEFSQKNPDFKEAYSHAVQSKLSEFEMLGYSQQQAAQLLHEDEMAIVSKAFQDGVNPAERIYKFAQARGYQKPSAGAPRLDQIQKSVNASKSLGNTSGKSQKEFSLESISQLSQEELREFVKSKKNWERVGKLLG